MTKETVPQTKDGSCEEGSRFIKFLRTSFIGQTFIWYKKKPLTDGLKESLESGSGIGFFINLVLGHFLAALILIKQYFYLAHFSIPTSAVEIYLAALGMFVIVNQARMWGLKKTEERFFRKGEYVLLMWTATVLVSWSLYFFDGKVSPVELKEIFIGVLALYAPSRISTAINNYRCNKDDKKTP